MDKLKLLTANKYKTYNILKSFDGYNDIDANHRVIPQNRLTIVNQLH